jgi:hypothetical protein
MLNAVGLLIIVACVFGSFIMSGGKMGIILEALPHELMAIGGAAIGAFIVGNSLPTVKLAGKGLMRAFKGGKWKHSDYLDLLTLLFQLLNTFRKGGATAIEPHLDAPEGSAIFSQYPRILRDHHLVEFICDYAWIARWTPIAQHCSASSQCAPKPYWRMKWRMRGAISLSTRAKAWSAAERCRAVWRSPSRGVLAMTVATADSRSMVILDILLPPCHERQTAVVAAGTGLSCHP